MHYKFGVMGVSFSTMVTLFLSMVFVMIYTWKVSEYHIDPVPRKIRKVLNKNEVKVYLNISIPSVVMIMAEWIGVEILIILSAQISVAALGAMSISYSYHNVIY